MARILSTLLVLSVASLPAAAEEIALKDGTKIVGHLNSLNGDKIEVVTAYGKMQVKRSDVVTISFPENNLGGAPASVPDPAAVKKDAPPAIDEALNGTQYVNRTGKFSLTLPAGWVIDPDLPHSKAALAGLSSKDKMRFLMVVQEEYTGSLESYKDLGQLQARGSFGNYEELSESSVAIDGKTALLISYRGTLSKSNNLPVQFLTAIIPSGTTFTRVTSWCVEPLFHETQPTFEKILTSYRSVGQISASAGSSKP
jgi:hypothetical protein